MRKEVELLEGKGVPAFVHRALHGVFDVYQKNTQTFLLWIGFMTLSFVVYCFLSSGDFSFLLVSLASINRFLLTELTLDSFFCRLMLHLSDVLVVLF